MKKNLGSTTILIFTLFVVTFPTDGMASIVKAKSNSGTVNFTITVDAPEESSDVKVWIPYPVSSDYQSIENVLVDGNFDKQAVYRVKKTGSMLLYLEWNRPAKERTIKISFEASAMERMTKKFNRGRREFPVEVMPYLEGSRFIPIDGQIKKIARDVTRGKYGVDKKARAVYDWVVENTFRDPSVKGCGLGIVDETLAKKGGKCADISSVFVSVARSAGVPAREVFGMRLGTKDGLQDISKGHHCWAEFYLPGTGWVQTDPADVRKVMQVNNLTLDQVKDYRDYYFKSVGPNRIALGHGGRNYTLNPPQSDGPINYFMYPYAEVDGKSLEWLAAQKRLKYNITYNKSDQ